VVDSPFFDKVTIDLPPQSHQTQVEKEKPRTLTIIAKDAPSKPYIKSLTINGRKVDIPLLQHEDIVDGGEIVFEMSDRVEAWGNALLVGLIDTYALCGVRYISG
jgi:putative alpha-1,2-mannosidase